MNETVQMSAVECRIVGSLIEKAFLTPDVYPMTTNAMVSACNQKTNRDPVMKLDAVMIDSALLELRQRELVRRVHTPGSRSTKHRHTLDEALSLDSGQLAIVSVLLLRGDQTIGELRLRTERQHGFETLEEVEACLNELSARPQPLVEQLVRQPGQKEARWRHLLADDAEPAPIAATPTAEPVPAPAPVVAPEPTAAAAASTPPGMAERVAALEARVEALSGQLERLAAALGENLD